MPYRFGSTSSRKPGAPVISEGWHWLRGSDAFMPHGHCYLWEPLTLWLNVGSDALIAACYFAIPGVLYYFVRQRRTVISYAWIPLMFAAFILLCGTTHIMEIWTVWNPDYRAAGLIKLLTGIISFATLLGLIWITPRALQLRTPLQLQAEVTARTTEIEAVNSRLTAEIAARDAAERQLREADQRKDEFLATLAHELRNPLAPIRNSARLLDSSRTDDIQRRHAHAVISRQTQRMALLLDDLLDVSRITRGRLRLKTVIVGLQSVIDAALETIRPSLDSKRQQLHLDLPFAPLYLDIDPLRISQALSNLLMNASKYTPPSGRITLSVRRDPDSLALVVSDTGIGFTPEAIPRMFEMFSQVDTSLTRTEGGLGIGLALVKGLVELHGGSIAAHSDGPGCGSEFTLRLPAERVRASLDSAVPATRETAPAAHSSARIMVTDDNRDAADTLAMLLDIAGFAVTVTGSGLLALELAAASPPEVMILDVGLPDFTGYEVARRVRAAAWGETVLLIAITGWGQENDKQAAYAAGFDHHLTKPVDPENVLTLLRVFFAN